MSMSTRPAAPAVIALLLVIAATLAACDKKTPPKPSVLSSAEIPSKAAVPLGSAAASDPSIPPASVVYPSLRRRLRATTRARARVAI